jgi:hypothetical protein
VAGWGVVGGCDGGAPAVEEADGAGFGVAVDGELAVVEGAVVVGAEQDQVSSDFLEA